MSSRLDSIIQEFLINKELPTDLIKKSMSVLTLQMAPEELASGLLSAVTKNYVLCAGIIPTLEPDAFWMQRTDLGLIVCMEDPIKLLSHALRIAEQNRKPSFGIGLTHGEGIILDRGEWLGIARFQSEHLARLGGQQQMMASMSFIRRLDILPEGIGALPPNKRTQELIDFPVVSIRDFRQPSQEAKAGCSAPRCLPSNDTRQEQPKGPNQGDTDV